MRCRLQNCLGRLLICIWFALGVRGGESAALAIDFQRDILPIFEAKCLRCHGAKRQGGKLDMRSVEALLAGGVSGPAITKGDPEKSLLIELIHFREMPPRKEKSPGVTEPELARLRKWITTLPVSADQGIPGPPRKPTAD